MLNIITEKQNVLDNLHMCHIYDHIKINWKFFLRIIFLMS